MNEPADAPEISGESVKQAAAELVDLLKLRTFPFGMKLF